MVTELRLILEEWSKKHVFTAEVAPRGRCPAFRVTDYWLVYFMVFARYIALPLEDVSIKEALFSLHCSEKMTPIFTARFCDCGLSGFLP